MTNKILSDGTPIVFKSDPEHYLREELGVKPNTIRKMDVKKTYVIKTIADFFNGLIAILSGFNFSLKVT